MFQPCPNCGFLVALIAGREASQRCPRCGSALVTGADAAGSAKRQPDGAATPEPAERAPDASAIFATGPSPTAAAVIVEPLGSNLAPTTHPAMPRAARVDDTPSPRGAEPAPEPAPAAPAEVPAPADAPGPEATPSADDPLAASIEPAPRAPHDGPSFMRRRHAPRASHGRRWPWAAALTVLALLLALQLVLAQRTELAGDATWRPLVLRVCGVFGCDVPAWREPRAFAMVARGVRPDAARAGVLHATATVRNDARWPQPAPVVVLRLADIDGRLVGARAVAPREYGHGPSLLAPGESLDIAFDVREPTGRVESFDFQLQ